MNTLMNKCEPKIFQTFKQIAYKNIDKAIQASALSGSYATVGTVAAGVFGTDITSTAFSSDAMGTNSSEIVPVSLDITNNSSPALANCAAEHQSTASTGLYSCRTIAQNLNTRFSKKVIPSMENTLDGKENNPYIRDMCSPFECENADKQNDNTQDVPYEMVDDESEKV